MSRILAEATDKANASLQRLTQNTFAGRGNSLLSGLGEIMPYVGSAVQMINGAAGFGSSFQDMAGTPDAMIQRDKKNVNSALSIAGGVATILCSIFGSVASMGTAVPLMINTGLAGAGMIYNATQIK